MIKIKEVREIIISISNNDITTSTNFAGYAGEHNATVLKFDLPEELQNSKYKYEVNITLPDGITGKTTLSDMLLMLTSTLTAHEGDILLQLVISESSSLIYKSGILSLKIKPSLLPTAVIGGSGVDGVGIDSAIVNEDGNLIITLKDNSKINAGYVKGADGKDGINGVDGRDGKDGINGIDGKDGEKGEKGDKGDKGDSYTLTDTDKLEIANTVLSLIPDGDEVSY